MTENSLNWGKGIVPEYPLLNKKPKTILDSVMPAKLNEKTVARNLSEAHWNYIYDLLMRHDIDDDVIDIVDFHYRTAFEHGFGHGAEWQRSKNA